MLFRTAVATATLMICFAGAEGQSVAQYYPPLVNGIGANLTNEQKRAHLTDLRREHLIDQVCIQEILPPEK